MTNTGILFKQQNGGFLYLKEIPLLKMMKFKQTKAYEKEAGGILLGRLIIDSKNTIIDDVSVPMKRDRRYRNKFFRSKSAHQKYLIEKWTASKGTCNYLGEWHTHPESIPSPSQVDFSNWKKRINNDTFDNNSLFFLILGTSKIEAWQCHAGSNIFFKLSHVKEDYEKF